jgi:hypothetical protein
VVGGLEAPLREKPVLWAGQAEVFAQGPAFVFAAEEVAALQFRGKHPAKAAMGWLSGGSGSGFA